MTRYGVVSKGMLINNAHLSIFLAAEIDKIQAIPLSKKRYDAILAWGRKPSTHKAARFSKRKKLPLLTLEDGFLRSLDGGINSQHGCSLVVDDLGIYFDTSVTSRLEQHILTQPNLPHQKQLRANNLIGKITNQQLSKYNLNPSKTLRLTTKTNILVVDQTFGDQSVSGAGASHVHFDNMLNTAIQNHPNATIWVKTHPQAKKTLRQPAGYFDNVTSSDKLKILSDPINPIHLIGQMDAVYTVSSHMGFEALMLGKPVHCFGVPWYAGWGLTHDEHAPASRLHQVKQRRGDKTASLEALFYAAYISYSRYVNPATKSACEIDEVIQWLKTNRKWALQLQDKLVLYKISAWKLGFLKAYLGFPKHAIDVCYFHTRPALKQGFVTAAAWGLSRRKLAESKFKNVWCIEDGFIRSKGLGAALTKPLSIVLDSSGIYYDANAASDIEWLLNDISLSDTERARAKAIRQSLLANRLSKYNLSQPSKWHIQSDNSIILVPGQVEDDLSVLNSLSKITTNLELLKAARNAHPDATIVYKPHPDVSAGLRKGHIQSQELKNYADHVVEDLDMPTCLDHVDKVVTISSLTGFEALLRGIDVMCMGLPFYAGWGLTEDRVLCNRRKRHLTLDELVYGTLIQYPIYRLPHGYGLAEAEDVIEFLNTNMTQSVKSKLNISQTVMHLRYRVLSYFNR